MLQTILTQYIINQRTILDYFNSDIPSNPIVDYTSMPYHYDFGGVIIHLPETHVYVARHNSDCTYLDYLLINNGRLYYLLDKRNEQIN